MGSHRDWNEEYQQCKSMPMNTISDKVMRARALYKIEQDFKLASKNGAEDHVWVRTANNQWIHQALTCTCSTVFFLVLCSRSRERSAADAMGKNGEDVSWRRKRCRHYNLAET